MNVHRLLPACISLFLPTLALGAAEPPAAIRDLPLDAFAAVGSNFAQSARLGEQGWSDAQIEAFMNGVRAAFRGQPLPTSPQAATLQAAIGQRVKELKAREMAAYFADASRLAEYMKQQAKAYRLQLSDSGLAYGLAPPGSASRPAPEDTVVLSYKALAADGTTEIPAMSAERRRVAVSALIPGLAEGVQMMAADSKGIFIVPPALSFGDGDWPAGLERGTPFFLMVTLHEVIPAP